MQRRNFLKSSALATSGLLFSAPIFGKTEFEKLRVGVIGCGDRGKGLINIMNQLHDHYSVVAVCDILPFRLKEAEKYKKSSWIEYSDYRKMINDKNVQAIVIATPLHNHFQMAVDTLAAGKHLFLEKTMTFTIDEAIELTKQSLLYPNQILQVGHQYRYVPLYFKVKQMIEDNYLGKVTQIDCRWDRNGNWRRPVSDPAFEKQVNWRMYKEFSGGLVAELLSHQIDFINWAFNTHPDEIFATGGIDYYKDGRETYDNVQVVLRYNDKEMIGNFGATCGSSREGYMFKIKGTKGTVELLVNEGIFYPEPALKKELQIVDGVTGATKIEWTKSGGIPILNERPKDGTWYALQDFAKCVFEKQIPSSNVHTGKVTAICVHLANEAMYSHTVKKWQPGYSK